MSEQISRVYTDTGTTDHANTSKILSLPSNLPQPLKDQHLYTIAYPDPVSYLQGLHPVPFSFFCNHTPMVVPFLLVATNSTAHIDNFMQQFLRSVTMHVLVYYH